MLTTSFQDWHPEQDEQGRLFDTYTATIRRNVDGVERQTSHTTWHSASWYWWAEGNACCDCNRHLFFERAIGIEPQDEEDDCSDGRYSVIRFDFPDDTTLAGPDA